MARFDDDRARAKSCDIVFSFLIFRLESYVICCLLNDASSQPGQWLFGRLFTRFPCNNNESAQEAPRRHYTSSYLWSFSAQPATQPTLSRLLPTATPAALGSFTRSPPRFLMYRLPFPEGRQFRLPLWPEYSDCPSETVTLGHLYTLTVPSAPIPE